MPTSRAAVSRLAVGCLAVAAILSPGSNFSSSVAGSRTFPSHLKLLGSVREADSIASGLLKGRKEFPVQTYGAFLQQQRDFPGSGVPADGYDHGTQQVERMIASHNVQWRELGPTFAPDANEPNPVTNVSSPVSGRATALAVVPATCASGVCGTMYLGTANGGVWKTTNAGQDWRPILQHGESIAVGVIVLDPRNPDIVYVGTGEPNLSGDSHRGIGILRSTDAGKTWVNLGRSVFVNRAVSALLVDPRTAGTTGATLYALSERAVTGGAETGGAASRTNPHLPQLGFYSSHNGGKTWALSLPPGPIDGGQNMVMDPSDPNTLYVAFVPDTHNPAYGGQVDGLYLGNGVYKTTDDGKNWTHLTAGLPDKNFDSVTVAIAASNPHILYAVYGLTGQSSFSDASGSGGPGEAMFKSTDSGATWSKLPNVPNACGDQCNYDSPLVVDPTNPDIVYTGGTANYSYLSGSAPECGQLTVLPLSCHATIIKTTDSGATWTDISENGSKGPLHPDDHSIVLSPTDPKVVYTVNDGGIFHSPDGGQNWNDLNKGLGTLQFTGLAQSPDGAIYAGTQDNGTFKYTGSTTWHHIQLGDGGPTGVNPANSKVVYTSYYGPILFRSDGSGNQKNLTFIAPFAGDFLLKGLGQFYEPYAIAPSKPSTIFFGTYRIWRSNLGGGIDGNHDGDITNDASDKNDWVPISFDLRCPGQPTDPRAVCSGPALAGRGIANVAVSPNNPNVVVAAASNGRLWITTNALAPVKTDGDCTPTKNLTDLSLCNFVRGPVWREIDAGLPRRYPTSIIFAPGSSARFYVALSGFDKNTRGHSGHIFATDNAGKTWHNLNGTGRTTSLPDLPFSAVALNPSNGHLYAAADYGVFASINGGRVWTRIDAQLPSAPVYAMQYSTRRHTVIVATHGRGIWETVVP